VEEYKERRQSVQAGLDLRDTVSSLNSTVGDLKVAVGELKITVGNLTLRDGEDRATNTSTAANVTNLMLWKSRIQGQLALIWLLVGLIGGATIGHLLHLTP
jgi:hypothetical protein